MARSQPFLHLASMLKHERRRVEKKKKKIVDGISLVLFLGNLFMIFGEVGRGEEFELVMEIFHVKMIIIVEVLFLKLGGDLE